MEKPNKAFVGDQIQITSSGERYSSYTKFFDELCPELRTGYDRHCGESLKNGMFCAVIFCDYDHKRAGRHDLYVIEPETRPGVYYLVNERAFEICELQSSLIEIDEADIMSLFEVTSCE